MLLDPFLTNFKKCGRYHILEDLHCFKDDAIGIATSMNKECYQHSYVMYSVDFGIPVLGLVKADFTIQGVTYEMVCIWRV